ncbi:MAG: HAMP domain-containing histidine kinase [Chloroflexota bacterium]|nr:HAMP domain-containing histidine kinase [Chloroflexota bacterium]
MQAARSIEQYDATLDTLQRNLTIGSILATLFAFGIGWMLAGAALRPIDRITQTARAIGAEQDFARRVPYTHANDEVGRLASTFNTMLAQLGGAYTQVETALRAQRRFVADASHELRTPLTSIRGNVALLGRQPPIAEEDRSAVLADTEEETDRLIRLVNDLLLLARADAGRPLKSEPVAVGTLIDDVCRQARGLASGRRVECEDAGDLAVLADRDSLKQVILILLDNALKFSSPDTPVTIAVTEAEGQVTTSVRDVGPGIEPDKLPHIFERFYRGDVSRSGTGSGLGLAIAKQLTEAQHGDLTVRSEVGKGSTFTVSLPRATSTSALQMDRAAATESVK